MSTRCGGRALSVRFRRLLKDVRLARLPAGRGCTRPHSCGELPNRRGSPAFQPPEVANGSRSFSGFKVVWGGMGRCGEMSLPLLLGLQGDAVASEPTLASQPTHVGQPFITPRRTSAARSPHVRSRAISGNLGQSRRVQVDMWAAGVSLYLLATGRLPRLPLLPPPPGGLLLPHLKRFPDACGSRAPSGGSPSRAPPSSSSSSASPSARTPRHRSSPRGRSCRACCAACSAWRSKNGSGSRRRELHPQSRE